MPRTTADNVFFGFAASLTTLSFFRPFEAARLVGGVLTFGGTFGILQPLQLAHAFGIKWADAKSSVFVPGIGARNLAAGLTVSILAIKGQWTAVGWLLRCWCITGLGDTYICLKDGELASNHIINIITLASISYQLLEGGLAASA